MRYLGLLSIALMIVLSGLLAPEYDVNTERCTFTTPVPAKVYPLGTDSIHVEVAAENPPEAFEHDEDINQWLQNNGYTEFAGVEGERFDTFWFGSAVYTCGKTQDTIR